ncbi:MAG TPA: [FeFe] hydrogenase, group A [Ignavibacteria bacterium]
MENKNILYINGKEVEFNGERNLLEVIRKANIEIPTFCYHSELSVYGACRLCIVEIEGRGIVSSCSIKPEPGLKVKTHTKQVREIRKIALELLLANHDRNCTSCIKSSSCKLQEIAAKLGVTEVRFKKTQKNFPIDDSSFALVRDPNKCILCGDCVRACYEIQGIGAIDFAFRGADVSVVPAFGKNLGDVECVDCGQCARVCPTGAITPKSHIQEVWNALDNEKKYVVAQLAPAVRVAIGEAFNLTSNENLTGQIVSALKMLGFNKVFDTSFGADLTIIEEANEFKERLAKNENLPLMTSCCPAWVKYAEQYYPEFLDNISSCKSPQQMLGAMIKEILPEIMEVKKENIYVVSIMPCTAKKFEYSKDNKTIKDVDVVITTQELIRMIKEAGIDLEKLNPEPFDLPFGFKTGAGVIFGNSGGVSEAVLRYLYNESNNKNPKIDFPEVRGFKGIRSLTINYQGKDVKIAIVQGLKNAKNLLDSINNNEVQFDFIEVMSCPGGCIGGAGQPVSFDNDTLKKRAKDLYAADKSLQLHKSQDNIYVKELYNTYLGEVGGEKAHNLLHTHYHNRKRIQNEEISLITANEDSTIDINVCVGTSCFVNGSQELLNKLINYIDEKGLKNIANVKATFCHEKCDKGPTVTISDKIIYHCTFEKATDVLNKSIAKITETELEKNN